ncbi:hypothetical protein TSACC_22802 [Terrimicrobium sacchariphilum]|uniref:Uncharacterized protein n=1 Tax=Terrimicrobium sacchariphilum TaxID=690879 RepID=A0A146GCF2_TERSA|nr:hypothetical protein [Terrimicrobium sacchariphilum]GAT34377.1 hypothetical protein TSACC_22802 [Terrimicrobium sacchariphilum]
MLGIAAIVAFASIFVYVGNNEYHNKGWLLGTVSVLLSLGVTYFTPLSFLGMLGANLLLYAAIWIYNVVSGRSSRSSSGF